MWVYWVVFSISGLFVILDMLELDDKPKGIFVIFLAVILIFFSGLRGAIDNDYVNYTEIYRWIAAADIRSLIFAESGDPFFDVEPGYRLLNKLVSYAFPNYQFIFLFSVMLSAGINIYCYKHLSPYPLLSILLYLSHTFLLRDMMQIRAGIAASICLLSLFSLYNGKYRRFVAAGVLASLFHVAAVPFMLLVLPLYRYNPGRKAYSILLGAALLVGALYPFGSLIRLMPELDLLYKVQGYANNEHSDALGLLNPVLLKQVVLTIICLVFYDKLLHEFHRFKMLFICYFISTCWLLIFNDFGIIAGRIATFFSVTEVILIPVLLKSFLDENRWATGFMYLLMIFYAFTFFYINLHVRDFFLPYQLSAAVTNLL